MNRFTKAVLAVILCEGAGALGTIFTINSVTTWYVTLHKPSFNPPPWIFGPVWTLLYMLMGISLFLIWVSKKSKAKTSALTYFYIQLFLNSLWSILFFGYKLPLLSFIEVIAMWIMILFSIISFAKINKTAAYLLYPYLAWVTFASILNLSIVLLN